MKSVGISPDGAVLVVGGADGKWLILDGETAEVKESFTDGDEVIQIVYFSPDGSKVVAGSRDNTLYVYTTGGDYTDFQKVGECTVSKTTGLGNPKNVL